MASGETPNLSIDSLEQTWPLSLSSTLLSYLSRLHSQSTGLTTEARTVFSPELPAKLNHAEFRGNNLLFDLERPVDLSRAQDPRGPH